MLAHYEVVQEFGLSCMLGVAILFLAVIAVIPLRVPRGSVAVCIAVMRRG